MPASATQAAAEEERSGAATNVQQDELRAAPGADDAPEGIAAASSTPADALAGEPARGEEAEPDQAGQPADRREATLAADTSSPPRTADDEQAAQHERPASPATPPLDNDQGAGVTRADVAEATASAAVDQDASPAAAPDCSSEQQQSEQAAEDEEAGKASSGADSAVDAVHQAAPAVRGDQHGSVTIGGRRRSMRLQGASEQLQAPTDGGSAMVGGRQPRV